MLHYYYYLLLLLLKEVSKQLYELAHFTLLSYIISKYIIIEYCVKN